MAIEIELKGKLEGVICDETFAGVLNALNLSIAKGNAFTALDDMKGGHVMINIPQILTIKELDD